MKLQFGLLLIATVNVACIKGYQPLDQTPDGGTVTSTIGTGPLEHRLECNPVQNAGCDSTRGESCVYDVAKDNALCGQLTARLAHEEPCSPLDNVCDRNLTCTALPQDHESFCHRVCDADTGAGCENLPGTAPNYTCMRLVDRAYGVCVGSGVECDPNEDPCAETEVCSLLSGRTVCLPAGAAKLGESCLTEQCEKGGICVKLTDLPEPTCFLPCETQDAICPNPDEVCTGIDDQLFGICQKMEAACSPLAVADNRCPAGQICSLDRTDTVCASAGSVAVGGDCGPDAACAAPGVDGNGAVCARLVGEPSAKCYESCDLSFPACSNPGTGCSDIGLAGFGICI